MDLLKRLEISEINFLYVKLNSIFRFDSNYFQKELINQEGLIRNHNYKTLLNYEVDLKSFGAYSLNNFVEYLEEGVPFIRGINMKKGRILFDNMVFISENTNDLLWKSEVKPEMILLSMSGTIGEVAIASKNWKYPINSNQDIAKIDTKGKINPYLLYTFLLSKFGQNYLKRESRGSVQQHVFLSQIEQFEIPIFDKKFIQKQEDTIVISEELLNKFQELYSKAETILLQEIGLDESTIKHLPSKQAVEGSNPSAITNNDAEKEGFSTPNINVKNFKDSFGTTGRLDAEYYQKKYEVVIEKIKSYKNGFESLSIACNLKDTNHNPKENQEYKYIELSNIGKTGDINGCTTELGKNLPSRARRLVSKGDVIISSIEGSLQSCAMVGKEYDNALCSTGFYIINSDKINSETLIVLFKSDLMQSIMKQNCSGTILTGMNKNEFQNILVPLIEIKAQQQIAQLIEESFSLKKQSEHLLEVAKRAVEIAIEENEEVAIKYINDNSIF